VLYLLQVEKKTRSCPCFLAKSRGLFLGATQRGNKTRSGFGDGVLACLDIRKKSRCISRGGRRFARVGGQWQGSTKQSMMARSALDKMRYICGGGMTLRR